MAKMLAKFWIVRAEPVAAFYCLGIPLTAETEMELFRQAFASFANG